MARAAPVFRKCRECKIETPMRREGWNLLGIKWRCQVCGRLWIHDGVMGDFEVRR